MSIYKVELYFYCSILQF